MIILFVIYDNNISKLKSKIYKQMSYLLWLIKLFIFSILTFQKFISYSRIKKTKNKSYVFAVLAVRNSIILWKIVRQLIGELLFASIPYILD
jgi:flagellar biogenesis protein FliO